MSEKVTQEPSCPRLAYSRVPFQTDNLQSPAQSSQQQRFDSQSFGAQMFNRPPTPMLQLPLMYQSSVGCSFSPAAGFSAASSFSGEHSQSAWAANSAGTSSTADENGARSNTRWSDEQTGILVNEWKERIRQIESSKSTEAWQKVADAVNRGGQRKSIKQCKDKIRNLKQTYKDAKAHNRQTGRSPRTSPFYEQFDEVLGARPVVTMPGVVQAGLNTSSSSHGSVDSDNADTDDDAEVPPKEAGDKRKKHAQAQPKKKRARKAEQSSHDGESPFIDLTEKILDMQKAQFEMMERAQSRTEELMLKLEVEQRKIDEEARRRDQEFFVRMAALLKK